MTMHAPRVSKRQARRFQHDADRWDRASTFGRFMWLSLDAASANRCRDASQQRAAYQMMLAAPQQAKASFNPYRISSWVK